MRVEVKVVADRGRLEIMETTRTALTKQNLRDRCIPIQINRGWTAEYYEEDGLVFCQRGSKWYTETLVLCLGTMPSLPTSGTRVHWRAT